MFERTICIVVAVMILAIVVSMFQRWNARTTIGLIIGTILAALFGWLAKSSSDGMYIAIAAGLVLGFAAVRFGFFKWLICKIPKGIRKVIEKIAKIVGVILALVAIIAIIAWIISVV